jgi:hypothetical protein
MLQLCWLVALPVPLPPSQQSLCHGDLLTGTQWLSQCYTVFTLTLPSGPLCPGPGARCVTTARASASESAVPVDVAGAGAAWPVAWEGDSLSDALTSKPP